jgi:hypothetical protein
MSISVLTGLLAAAEEDEPEFEEELRFRLDTVNAVLQENGHPAHHEPVDAPQLHGPGEGECSGAAMFQLQHVRAKMLAEEDIVPDVSRMNDGNWVRQIRDNQGQKSHLLNHALDEGFFVPVDFERPIRDKRLEGRYLGSSQHLQAELREIAPVIGIEWSGDSPSDDQIDAWADEWQEHPFSPARNAWAHLWAGARISLEHDCIMELAC